MSHWDAASGGAQQNTTTNKSGRGYNIRQKISKKKNDYTSITDGCLENHHDDDDDDFGDDGGGKMPAIEWKRCIDFLYYRLERVYVFQ